MNDAYDEGQDAYIAGKDETHNPYDPNTEADACTSWNDGWNGAADDAEHLDAEGDMTDGEDDAI